MNKGNVAAVAVGVMLFLFTCTENAPSLNTQQQSGPAHRMENAPVTTESAVKGHPSVTARPLKGGFHAERNALLHCGEDVEIGRAHV